MTRGPEKNSPDLDNRHYPLPEESWCLDQWATPEELKRSELPSEETLSKKDTLTSKDKKQTQTQQKSSLHAKD